MEASDQGALVELAQALIRIPSATGNEAQIAAFVCHYFASVGFDAHVNDYNTVVALLRRGPGPTVLLDAHLDTVAADPKQWQHPPYAGEIEGDKLYGRGATDMKAALAAMMHAGKLLSRDDSWKGTLIITGTSWEEHFEGYTLGKATEHLAAIGLRPDYVIIGEASELNIKRGQRGRTRLHFDMRGREAHSAHPERGINAVYKAVSLIQKIRNMSLPEDDFLGKSIVELIGIDSLPKPVDSVVPYACRVSYDLRLLPGQSEESILAQFDCIIQALKEEDATFDASFHIASGELITNTGKKEVVRAFPLAWKTEESHPLVRKAWAALRKIGLEPKITRYDFCTNGSYSAGVAKIPTIGFGPGREDGAHIVDEYIEIGDLQKACAGYVAIIKSLLSD